MPAQICDRSSRQAVRTATTVVAATITLAAGCTRPPAPPGNAGPGSTTASTSVSTTSPSTLTALPTGTSSPVEAAEHWLAAYRSMSWTDGTPTGWIERVRPYVTAALDGQDQQYADAGGGSDWQDFVTKQCSTTVSNLGAVIPPESPGTASSINVQVTGIVDTTCEAGQFDPQTEPASATVVVTLSPEGVWLVNQRLF